MSDRDERTFRELLVELISRMIGQTCSWPTVTEAQGVVSYMKKTHQEACSEINEAMNEADKEIEKELGVSSAVALSKDRLIETVNNAGISAARAFIVRQILSVSEFAIQSGMWVEGDLLRMLAWSSSDPTGFTPMALRREMFAPPQTSTLKQLGEGSIIAASVELAHLAVLLCTSIEDRTKPKNNVVF